MAIYSVAVRTTNFTAAQACSELRTATTVRPKVLEVAFVTATGTAQTIGLGRPGAIGVTPGGTSTPQADDPGDPASSLTHALSWATSPTAPTVFHRRWNGAATVGVGIVWTFPRGLVVPISSSVVLWNITTSVAADVHFAFDE